MAGGAYTATVYRSPGSLTIDGILDEPAWNNAEQLSDFIFPWGNDRGTRSDVKLLWDNSAFYVGAVMHDSKIVASVTTGTSIDGDDMYEMHMSPDTALPDYFYITEFNLNLIFRARLRQAQPSGKNMWWEEWDISGSQTVVKIHGTANNASDTDSCWVAEMRYPFSLLEGWKGTGHAAPAGWNPAVPPADGSAWRFNVNRLNFDTYDGSYDYSIWSHNGNYPYGSDAHFHDHNNFGTIYFSDNTGIDERPSAGDRQGEIEVLPNPFYPAVTITVGPALRSKGAILKIFDLNGRFIEELSNKLGSTGRLVWRPVQASPGIYLAEYQTGGKRFIKKLVLAK
jgi:hypothetical protein